MEFRDAPPLPPFLESQLPFRRRMGILDSGPDRGRAIHFIDQGDPGARPVVMFHGNPTWSFLWRKVISLLPNFRCIAPDLLGLGFSDRPPRIEDHSLARHGDALAALMNALQLDSAIGVGQDWGGPMTTAVGARSPRLFTALLLANTSVLAPQKPRGTPFHRFARLPLISDLVFRGFGFPQNILHRIQGDPNSIAGEVARAYRWPLRGWRNRVAPLARARMVPGSPSHPSMPELQRGEEWLRTFSGPMALVWGMRDPVLGPAIRRHERELPRATVLRTEAGHFLQEEVPEVIAEEIRKLDAGGVL